ncbi:CK1 family protein kinase [Trichomonas vaginalis G3]|uniref:non-specific serine/threonine protein kinase n=1 Tax=Trichomonas vaginalis (strain ATCC PRA-98 / G3) TaxID=412133 RepID=A2F7D7_TRIV3|nr:STKc CK1 domain-containing protein [Trichomonas vaginalis G3]EAX99205.1 CK1 family protein kinase [Trichomonas vaginalis G3]KAI5487956.1 STKc CK1 domain-containing protein [Trichomonas vaginalis G3]|eukprot:XP_001312135.1 CK1 family protein kinase [Trichomonas vaginalis G3]
MAAIDSSHYELIKKIGGGSFGQIYIGEDTQTHKKVAVKLESKKTSVPQLCYESKLYVLFSGCPSVPRLYWFGSDHTHNIMVIDLLGKSLEDLFIQCGQKLSLKTVLMLADQMISCVEYIHSKNFIHNDIKPDNFVMGRDEKPNQVFVIDFGLSKKYRDPFTHEHIAYADGRSLTGTPRYASIAALQGIRQTRRDDMESLGYVWMYLLRGSLPWMGINLRTRGQKFDKILAVKEATSIESLCQGFPQEFADYLHDVRNLKFDEQPNYAAYRKRFRDLFISKGYVFDYVYDWTDTSKSHKKKELVINVEPTRKAEAPAPENNANAAKLTKTLARERRELNQKAQKQELEKEKANIQAPPGAVLAAQEIQRDPQAKNYKKAENEQNNRTNEDPALADALANLDFDMNHLPPGGPLPNGPFPRPMWRSRYPRWMTPVQTLQVR